MKELELVEISAPGNRLTWSNNRQHPSLATGTGVLWSCTTILPLCARMCFSYLPSKRFILSSISLCIEAESCSLMLLNCSFIAWFMHSCIWASRLAFLSASSRSLKLASSFAPAVTSHHLASPRSSSELPCLLPCSIHHFLYTTHLLPVQGFAYPLN